MRTGEVFKERQTILTCSLKNLHIANYTRRPCDCIYRLRLVYRLTRELKTNGLFPFFFTAQKHLSELNKRLDTTERTMHLVMKQMEAVTKCLAKTLADDPALCEDKTLAEITEGLVNLKESNV